jgi:hypothetical protein
VNGRNLSAPKARKTRTTLPETKPYSLLRTSQISESWHDELAVAAAAGMGHQRTFRDVRVMSALPPITDVDRPHQGPLRCLPSITLKNDAHIIGRHRHGLNQDKIVTCSQVRYVGEITHAPLSILRS